MLPDMGLLKVHAMPSLAIISVTCAHQLLTWPQGPPSLMSRRIVWRVSSGQLSQGLLPIL